MQSLLEEAIQEHFGERCPDFEPGCPCCRAWAEFDEIERLRAALVAFADHFGPLEDNHMLHEGARRCFALARAALNDQPAPGKGE